MKLIIFAALISGLAAINSIETAHEGAEPEYGDGLRPKHGGDDNNSNPEYSDLLRPEYGEDGEHDGHIESKYGDHLRPEYGEDREHNGHVELKYGDRVSSEHNEHDEHNEDVEVKYSNRLGPKYSLNGETWYNELYPEHEEGMGSDDEDLRPELGNPDEWGTYYQGDIRFREGEVHRNGQIDEKKKWPRGQLIFEYDESFDYVKKKAVEKAMQHYHEKTNGCITFKRRTHEDNYVHFTGNEADSCFSFVGMVGDSQQLNLPYWCAKRFGSVVHEILHALGFFHMHSAPSRDHYIIVREENVLPGTERNFERYDDSSEFGFPYDYESVMHYSPWAFSHNGEMTIVTTDPHYQFIIGQRTGLSKTDLAKLMAMYNC